MSNDPKMRDKRIAERPQGTKTPKPYFTTYPYTHWCWFDVAVYGEFSPKTGNLPTGIFGRLLNGLNPGCTGLVQYHSEDEAIADYKQAITDPQKAQL